MPYHHRQSRRRTQHSRRFARLETLERRELLSFAAATATTPTFYPDMSQMAQAPSILRSLKTPQLVATVGGVDPTLAPHAMVQWDTGLVTAAIFQYAGFGKLNILVSNAPPSQGQHQLKVAFWQTTPAGQAVNASQASAVADVSAVTSNGRMFSAYVQRPFSGVVGDVSTAIPNAFDGQQTPFSSTAMGYTLAITATIQWGDGASSPGLLFKDNSGKWEVFGTHVYLTSGALPVLYSITQTVTGPDGQGHTRTVSSTTAPEMSEAEISPVIPTLSQTHVAFYAIQAAASTGVLGAIGLGFNINQAAPSSDLAHGIIRYIAPGHATGSEYHVVIAWGDGQFSNASLTPNDPQHWMVSGTHTYNNLQGYTVFVAAQYVGAYVPGQATQPAAHAYPPQAQFSTLVGVAQQPYQGGTSGSLQLNSNGLLNQLGLSGGTLTVTGPTGSGSDATTSGAGTLTLSGASGFTGGTITSGSPSLTDFTAAGSPITIAYDPTNLANMSSFLAVVIGAITQASITVDSNSNHTLTLTIVPASKSSAVQVTARNDMVLPETSYQLLLAGSVSIPGITVQDGQLFWNGAAIPIVEVTDH